KKFARRSPNCNLLEYSIQLNFKHGRFEMLLGTLLATTEDCTGVMSPWAYGPYDSVRLRWNKKASVEKKCQVYHLVNENSYPCLRVCGLYEDYVDKIAAALMQTSKDAFVFPHVTMLPSRNVKVDWFKAMEQNYVQISDIVESSPGLPVGIPGADGLVSLGGCKDLLRVPCHKNIEKCH
ncbi:hypothetical protein DYB31_011404, partial [Aphanomyces astaci]